MDQFFPAAAVIVLVLIILYDILGHRNMKIRRRLPDWIFLCLLGVALTAAVVIIVRPILRSGTGERSGLYLGYRYLMDGDSENARRSVENDTSLSEQQKTMIDILGAAVDEDYAELYFDTRKLLDGKISNSAYRNTAEQLQQIAAVHLNQDNTDQVQDTSGKEKNQDENNPVDLLIETCFQSENLSRSERLEEYYSLDRKIRSGEVDSVDDAEVKTLVAKFGESTDSLKLAMNYYVQNNDYTETKELAQELLDKYRCAENYVIYTDVIAQESCQNSHTTLEPESSDPEIQKYMDEAQALEIKAEKYAEGDEKREKLLNEAEAFYQMAANVEILRAINFIEAKKPFLFDNTGMYDLQLAKLYLLCGQREKAGEYVRSVMEHASMLSDSSPIKQPLMDVLDAYNQSEPEESSPLLTSAVRRLIEAQCQGVIPVAEGSVNERMADYVVSALKYDKLGIFVSKVDISGYPEITAYLNINGQKDNRWGMAGEFYADDFEIIDTQYQINDFRINADGSKTGVDIAIVLDTSGSMEGTPLEDAKLAARACVDHMEQDEQKLSVISYSDTASTVVARTDSAEKLTYGISQLNAGGGTDISLGITEGLDSLKGGKSGTKAVILLTDGQDGGSQEAMDEVISRANGEGICIYTVGLGDVNEEYLKDIAQRTGGKFLLADNTTELEDIYTTLQRYIINNYVLTYTVTENPEEEIRNLTVSIPSYHVSGERNYTIADGAVNEAETGSDGILPVEGNETQILSVSPGSLSVEDVEKGTELTITGRNLTEDMHISIGTLELQNLRLSDDSTLTGTLKGSLSAGSYSLRVKYSDGRIGVMDEALYVFRPGVTTGIRIGGTRIRADSIGQMSEDCFVASGNVLINDFLHCDTSLMIRAYDLPQDVNLSMGQSAYLGNSGQVSGNGTLYISYAQADGAEGNHTSFASLVMGGKNYNVIKGEFSFDIDGMDTSMGRSWELTVPGIANVTVGEFSLETDGIKIHIDELNPKEIYEDMKDGLTGKKNRETIRKAKEAASVAKQDNDKPQTSQDAFQFHISDTSASLDLALTQENIVLGGEVELEMNDSFQFGCFALNQLKLKFNTLDDSQEYWYLGGSIDFSSMVPGFGGTGISGMDAHVSSWYWMFDEMEVGVDLYPGIGIYNALYVDQMALKVDGVSSLFLDSDWISDQAKEVMFSGQDIDALQDQKPHFQLVGTVGADVNLFKSLNLKVPEDMTKWGELGTLDGAISFDFTGKKFDITADLSLLKHKIANASLGISTEGLYANGRAMLELEMLGCQLGGGIDLGVNTSLRELRAKLGVDGHVDCNMLNAHLKGKASVEVLANYDGSAFSVSLCQGTEEHRFWYEDNGELLLLQKLHFS